MLEAGVLLDLNGKPIHWHLPLNRSMAALPDSKDLWHVIWESRENISGFAHSHPGYGNTGPSWTDITTFKAIENGLGKKLDWWITSGDQMILVRYTGPEKYDYSQLNVAWTPDWCYKLRELSGYYKE